MSRDPKNVLILHGLGPKRYRLSSIEKVDLIFRDRFKKAQCYEHDLHLFFPKTLKKIQFDLVIVASTFLAKIAHPRFYKKIIREYSFLKNENSLVVALPQDDYWCQQNRDEWYAEYVDLLVSVFDESNWQILYPEYLRKKKKIIRGHTVYLTQDVIRKYEKFNKTKKKYDLVYRTRGFPSFPNRLGFIKYNLGDLFLKHLKDDLNVNFSNKSKDILYGEDWLEFIASSKAIIGSNSGSSILVKNHKEMLELKKKMILTPVKSNLKEDQFFLFESESYFFTDISPRNIEAALTETLQILLPGTYGEIMTPNYDYVILKEDFSNLKEVVDVIKDKKKLKKIVKNCKKTILNEKSLKISELEKNIILHLKTKSYVHFTDINNIVRVKLFFHYLIGGLFLDIKYFLFYLIKEKMPSPIYNILKRKYFKI